MIWISDVLRSNEVYPDISHFFYPVVLSVIVTFIRSSIERHFWEPLGIRNGLKSSKGIAEQDEPSELKYFKECGWRFVYHTTLFVIGISVLLDKPWLWNIEECWTNFPNQMISSEVWWYYIIHMSIYMSHIYSQMLHRKRDDFVEMFIHHVVTILLMALSWVSNTVRIGTLVLIVHDSADIFMEAARIAKLLKYPKICNLLFGLFFITWIVSRLGIFPFHILKNIWFDAPIEIVGSPVISSLILLLHILLALQLFWTCLILQVLYKFVVLGKVVDDSRSFPTELVDDDNFNVRKAN